MSADLETEIAGSPGQVEGAATWLRNQLAPAVDGAVDALVDARSVAGSAWQSDDGEAFQDQMRTGSREANQLYEAAKAAADDLETFATKLRNARSDMSDVRATALAQGLTVSGTVVRHPGPGPERPPVRLVVPQDELAAYNATVDAWNDHQALLEAFNTAAAEAERVDRRYGAACEELSGTYDDLDHAQWLVNVGDVSGAAVAAGLSQTHVSILQRSADYHAGQVGVWRDRIRATDYRFPGGRQAFDRDFNALRDAISDTRAAREAAEEARVSPRFRGVSRVLGPLGFGLGVHSDVQDGESDTQAVVSQGGALLAGVAMGAAIGSVIPGPGTAVGAVAGAVVVGVGAAVTSIFADGAIDSVFENGPDVGAAVDEGLDALADTGEAISDAAGDLVDGIGSLF